MKTMSELVEMDKKIQAMKEAALELKSLSNDNPAVFRNCSRILASVKMLEMNVSDLIPGNWA